MGLKIFKEGEEQVQEPKPVYLRLKKSDDDGIDLCACNSDGYTIAILLCFSIDEGVYAVNGTYSKLKEKGYDTSFCIWNKKDGVFVE